MVDSNNNINNIPMIPTIQSDNTQTIHSNLQLHQDSNNTQSLTTDNNNITTIHNNIDQPTIYIINPNNYITSPLACILRYRHLCDQLCKLYNSEVSNNNLYNDNNNYNTSIWYKDKTIDDIERMLNSTKLLCIAIQIDNGNNKNKAQSSDIVGFCSISGDITHEPLLEDIIVKNSMRNKGIGKMLINNIIQYIFKKYNQVKYVDLYCHSSLQLFYNKFNFYTERTDNDTQRCLMRLNKPDNYDSDITYDIKSNLLYQRALELQAIQRQQEKLRYTTSNQLVNDVHNTQTQQV